MSSPDAVHFSIENFNEDFNMLTIIPCSNILELNFVHPEGHKTTCFEWIGRSWIFTLCEKKSVRLMWNNPYTRMRARQYKVQQYNDARFSSITCCTIKKVSLHTNFESIEILEISHFCHVWYLLIHCIKKKNEKVLLESLNVPLT